MTSGRRFCVCGHQREKHRMTSRLVVNASGGGFVRTDCTSCECKIYDGPNLIDPSNDNEITLPSRSPGPCQHTARKVIWAVDQALSGTVMLAICENPKCGHIEATCQHTENEWTINGTVLTCQLCGKDGT